MTKPRTAKPKDEPAPAPAEAAVDTAVADTGLSAIDDELEALMNS